MSFAVKHARRFAPLDPALGHESDAPRLKGIVFDVDGTLWYAHILSSFLFLVSSFRPCVISIEQRPQYLRGRPFVFSCIYFFYTTLRFH